MMEYLLGIDLGCSACKVMLFDTQGNPIAYAHKELLTHTPATGFVEQDANGWWEATCANIQHVINEANINPKDILGIGVTGQGPSLVVVDENGIVLRPAIIHRDLRGLTYVQRHEPFIEKISKLIGSIDLTFLSELPVFRLLWIKENEPHIFKRIHGCMMSWDFIKYRLTGEITRLAELDKFCVTPCKLFNMPSEWFGKAYSHPTDIAGYVTDDAARQTHLEEGTPVVLGTFDNPCNTIGAGLTEDGIAMDQAGTTEIINVVVSKRPKRYGAMKHLIPGLWIISTSPYRGVILQWFIDQFVSIEAEKLGINPYQLLDLKAESVKPGSDRLIFLPYLTGESSAFYDPNARGVFLGISLNHRREHFIRAIFEGIAFSLRHILERYQALGVKLKDVRLGGGGAKSRVWNQIKADVLGRPVSVLNVLETGCLGAAILAGVGAGVYSSIKEASESMVRVSERIEPNRENHEKYNKLYKVYKEAYPQLKEIFAKLACI